MKILFLIFMITLVWVITSGQVKSGLRVLESQNKGIYLEKAESCPIIVERRDVVLCLQLTLYQVTKSKLFVFESHDARSVISRDRVWSSPDPYPSGFT
jgi:hypothetical protein